MVTPQPSRRPALVYDGDCGFCRYWIGRWRRRTGAAVAYVPFQDPAVAEQYPEVSTDAARQAVQLVEPDGVVVEGALAVFRLMHYAGWRLPVWLYERVPPFAALFETAYRAVADHRAFFSALTLRLWGKGAEPSTYALSSWLFLRLLGLAYLAAFWSLGVQVSGLIGPHGILPAGAFAGVAMTDARLVGICVAGACLSVLLIAGVASVITLPLLWALYWALSRMSADFLAFQWDALLLETGLLAIFLAPLTLVDPPGRHEPRAPARWLLWWLLFRLMLASGIVKLASGDPVWRDLTALGYHYETQPLPTPIAWYVHQLPMAVHRVFALLTFTIELGLPWLIFAPRRLRGVACAGFVLLQTVIALTGNYAFFNELTAALALTLLDDAQMMALIRRRIAVARDVRRRWARGPIYAVALVTVPVSLAILVSQARMHLPGTSLILPMYELTAPLRSVNGYGLFAVMTTTRPEIIVEGSADGITWKPYNFRYKPGPVDRPLRWVAPHQPRLDWQMWFAALGDYRSEYWFEPFCRRLLEGAPEVTGLLADNPFPDRPPAFVRATLYQYRYADAQAHRGGQTWTRDEIGPYSPVFQTGPPVRQGGR